MAYKTFLNGYPLPASELNTYLMQQSVATFANSTDRAAAITSPVEGQLTYLEDSNQYFTYTGSAWTPLVAPVSPNAIINGAFDIWQRGTSFSAVGYTADRWYFSFGGTVTASKETSIVPTSTNAIKVTTGASSSFGELYNALEYTDLIYLAGQKVTLSAYVRAQPSFSGNAVISIQTNTTKDTQTGGTWTEVAAYSYTPSSTSYERMVLDYLVPVGTQGLRIKLGFASAQASGTGLYWGNVQLEAGSVATPFRRNANTYQGELAACQRYYQRYSAGSRVVGAFYATTACRLNLPLEVQMRTAPTVTVNSAYSVDAIGSGSTTTFAASNVGSTNTSINFDLGGASPSRSTYQMAVWTGGAIEASAEL